MSMKTIYITAMAAGALMLCNCNRESLTDAGETLSDQTVKFVPSVSGGMAGDLSKGILFNESGSKEPLGKYVDNFMVTAYSSSSVQIIPDDATALGTYVTNGYQKVKKQTGAAGSYWMTVQKQTSTASSAPEDADDEYIWKQGEVMTFYAYANLPASGATMANTASGQTLTYTTVPADAADQTDILLGFYKGDGKTGPDDAKVMTGTASMEFSHPLTAVRFVKGMITDGITIKSISLEGVAESGTATMDSDGLIEWTVPSYIHTLSQSDDSGLAVDGKSYIGKPFIIIPQITKQDVNVTVAFSDHTSKSVSIATDNWQMGYVNTYTINYADRFLTVKAVSVEDFSNNNVKVNW